MIGSFGSRTRPLRQARRLFLGRRPPSPLAILLGRRHGGFVLFLLAAFAAAIIFTDSPPPAPALHYAISVYDGDTIRLGQERIRIVGLDTPELGHRAECEFEALAAERAKQALIGEIARGNVELQRQGTDRYGRTLARVTVDGRDVADTLIAQGLARPYGGGRRESWCS
ncbi:thermonuclease family protein [Parvibaculum sp.]|uniref:thermonuclease family protein n=1 Tax=Parvibaculum sp. TaxID=2024848 RepID=UPI00391A82F2